MESIWLKSYPPAIPAEVNIHEHRSLAEVLDKSAARYGSLPAFVNMGHAITYSELDRASSAIAGTSIAIHVQPP